MDSAIERLIKKLNLQPHPEGGYFRETYRSSKTIALGAPYNGPRSESTCIYFLLTSGSFSAFHRIHQDEAWHFYDGSPVDLHVISPEGEYSKIVIGNELDKGQTPQFVVPGGHWFAAEVSAPDSYSLVGCTVAPGFDFRDFEMAKREELLSVCPNQEILIAKLTR